jgi:hypothetical protein
MMSYIFFEDATDKVTRAERKENKTRIEERKREGKNKEQNKLEREGELGIERDKEKFKKSIVQT